LTYCVWFHICLAHNPYWFDW